MSHKISNDLDSLYKYAVKLGVLDSSVRLPKNWSQFATTIQGCIAKCLASGKVKIDPKQNFVLWNINKKAYSGNMGLPLGQMNDFLSTNRKYELFVSRRLLKALAGCALNKKKTQLLSGVTSLESPQEPRGGKRVLTSPVAADEEPARKKRAVGREESAVTHSAPPPSLPVPQELPDLWKLHLSLLTDFDTLFSDNWNIIYAFKWMTSDRTLFLSPSALCLTDSLIAKKSSLDAGKTTLFDGSDRVALLPGIVTGMSFFLSDPGNQAQVAQWMRMKQTMPQPPSLSFLQTPPLSQAAALVAGMIGAVALEGQPTLSSQSALPPCPLPTPSLVEQFDLLYEEGSIAINPNPPVDVEGYLRLSPPVVPPSPPPSPPKCRFIYQREAVTTSDTSLPLEGRPTLSSQPPPSAPPTRSAATAAALARLKVNLPPEGYPVAKK